MRSLARSTLLLLACVLTAQASLPNIIFLITDDQDQLFDSVSVMPRYTQHMRDGGMSFTNAFVASPICCPSRTSLLSGRYPHNLNDQNLGWCGNFLKQYVNNTFISRLKQHGYRTGLFGKLVNDMGDMCSAKAGAFVPKGFNISEGDRFVAMCNEVTYYKNTFNIDGSIYTTGTGPTDYLTSVIGNHTIDWLQHVAAASRSSADGAPFFAYVAPHAPHFPAEPAPWYKDAPLPPQHEQVPRVPSYNGSVDGKSWAIRTNPPFSQFTSGGIDTHYRNRLRTLLSVDDLMGDMFAVLERAGVLQNTFVITTSDHGYHLGNFRVPFEKALPYETDIRVPFYIRGPGIAPGSSQPALVSLMDVGATILELAGVVAPGTRTTDGRSLVPLLFGGEDVGRTTSEKAGEDKLGKDISSLNPSSFSSSSTERLSSAVPWRDRLVVEFMGFGNQWMDMCQWVFNYSGPCPAPPSTDISYLINGPQNTYVMLRILNSTADVTYAEFRPTTTMPVPASTNWTEAYDVRADPWNLYNAAVPGSSHSFTPVKLAQLKQELWAVANCEGKSCP